MALPPASDEDILNCIFSPMLPSARKPAPSEESKVARPPVDRAVVAADIEAVKLADEGKLDEAIEKFSAIILSHPTYPSAYNNRAQAHLLNKNPDAAFADVEQLLALPDVPNAVRARALIQKSMVLRLRGHEDAARLCMEEAAALGNEFARAEAVKMNPYAAMCNAMLASVSAAMAGPPCAKDAS